MSIRLPVTCLAAFLTVTGAAAPCLAQFTATDTNNVSVVYLHPTQSFIVPHVGRSFENALAFHEKLFDFKPR